MIGEIRQNFTEASASVGLILATALLGGRVSILETGMRWVKILSGELDFLFSALPVSPTQITSFSYSPGLKLACARLSVGAHERK